MRRKTKTVEIDVEIDDFSTSELLLELNYRAKKKHTHFSISEEKELIRIAKLLDSKYDNPNLIDKMKIDFLLENLEKISLEKLEQTIQ